MPRWPGVGVEWGPGAPGAAGGCWTEEHFPDDECEAIPAAVVERGERKLPRGVSLKDSGKFAAKKRVAGKDFAIKYGQRRPGDPPMLFNNPTKICSELGWQAQITDLDEIVASAWRWFKANPRGYGT